MAFSESLASDFKVKNFRNSKFKTTTLMSIIKENEFKFVFYCCIYVHPSDSCLPAKFQ